VFDQLEGLDRRDGAIGERQQDGVGQEVGGVGGVTIDVDPVRAMDEAAAEVQARIHLFPHGAAYLQPVG
jgi:hypothetical protein